MAIPTEYPGLVFAIRLAPAGSTTAVFYRSQRTRLHIHGDTGDVTSGEDLSKRRIGTVPDWEITFTKASFDDGSVDGIGMNPFSTPLNFVLFTYIGEIALFPGGVDVATASTFADGLIDDFELDQDANMLQPFSMHVVAASGEDPDEDPPWWPITA